MGIFSKLFGRKVAKNVLNSRNSANYLMSCDFLRTVFLQPSVSVDTIDNNICFGRELVRIAVEYGLKQGVSLPSSYYNLPVSFASNQDMSCYGYIVEFNDAKVECDCNFVGMMVKNGEKVYYTSEYYASFNHFSVCCFYESGSRSIGIGRIKPRTLEEFKQVVLG